MSYDSLTDIGNGYRLVLLLSEGRLESVLDRIEEYPPTSHARIGYLKHTLETEIRIAWASKAPIVLSLSEVKLLVEPLISDVEQVDSQVTKLALTRYSVPLQRPRRRNRRSECDVVATRKSGYVFRVPESQLQNAIERYNIEV